MTAKSISFCQGKGSLSHNNREFVAKNVDSNRTKDNITFISEPIAEAYQKCFGGATERYNARQKRKDRQISDYYENTFKHKICNTVITASDKRKSFYEDIVQIGTMQDSGVGTADGELVAECLKEYMNGFQKRNPNFYVFNAVLHMDEATPHLHIDYIPIGHYKRGLDTQNGLAQALKEMGFGSGKDAVNRWRIREREVLENICRQRGIEISEPTKSRGSYSVDEYKELQKRLESLNQDVDRLNAEIEQKKQERQKILHYVPDYDKRDKEEHELLCICSEFDELLKNPFVRWKSKDELLELSSKMVKMVENAQNARIYAEAAQAEIFHENQKLGKYLKELEGINKVLKKNNSELKAELQEKSEVLDTIDRTNHSAVMMAERQLIFEKQQREIAENQRKEEQRKRGYKIGR